MDLLATTMSVRNRALELGFDACGFSRAAPLDREARQLEEWLNRGRHGEMGWMENNFEKRVDPEKLLPGTKSILSVIGSYHFGENRVYDSRESVPKIAKYARGRDYHKVFKKRLFRLFDHMKETIGDVNGRVFVDSAPVMDKVWAQRSGLGWIGKNSNLLNRELGSWFLIGEIFVDVPFVYDAPVTDHCGSCTRCIDACPTDAIHQPYQVDGSRCISYLTIELKEQIPEEYHQAMGSWMFGCDICQDVCPWNRKAAPGHIEDLKPRPKLFIEDPEVWESLREEEYNALFEGTPVRRAKYPKFIESATIVAQNLRARLEE